MRCKHGLPPEMCAPCAGVVRTAKPIRTDSVLPTITATAILGMTRKSWKCFECGQHEFTDSDKGRVRCPQCHTEYYVIVDNLTAEITIKAAKDFAVVDPFQKRAKRVESIAAQWSITTKAGVITICGVCSSIANEHEERRREHEVRLTSYIRTRLCKDCGDIYRSGEICPKTLQEHRRRWLIRSIKVAACKECAGLAEYEVDPDDLTPMGDGRCIRQAGILDIWKLNLKERGLL